MTTPHTPFACDTPIMTPIHLASEVIGPDADIDHLSVVPCPSCRIALTIHQPDEAWPERLLATCQRCQGWLLIDVEEMVIVRLPDRRAVRAARESLASRTK